MYIIYNKLNLNFKKKKTNLNFFPKNKSKLKKQIKCPGPTKSYFSINPTLHVAFFVFLFIFEKKTLYTLTTKRNFFLLYTQK